MIQEEYVSYETAKLLKEAGFDVPCNSYYELEDGEAVRKDCIRPYDHNGFGDTICSRPTLALAARWLREVHGIHIYAIQTNLPLTAPQTTKWEWGYIIDMVDDPNSDVTACDMYFDCYESAFEIGLQEAIKLSELPPLGFA